MDLPERLEDAVFGPPPLIEGEDPRAYHKLRTRIATFIRPADILENILARTVVDSTWDEFRYLRMKTDLMRVCAHEGLERVFQPLTVGGAQNLAYGWAARDPGAVERVKQILASADLTIDHVMAQTLAVRLDDIERLDLLMANAQSRRNNALREIEQHRATLGQNLRRPVQQIEDD
jgi:hypothetical protein